MRYIIISVLCIGLYGCGGGNTQRAADQTPSSSKPTQSSTAVSSSAQSSTVVVSSSIQSSSVVSSSVVSSSIQSSSTANSSSNSTLACAAGNGVLFADSLCSDWTLKIWQAKTDYSQISPFIDQAGINLTTQVIDSGDVAHGKVFDMSFNSLTNWSALPQFRATDATNKDGIGIIDLTGFSTGKISFDIKVIANPSASKILARFECSYPCTTRDVPITVPTLNQWTHVEYSIQDLVAQGLNLKNVDVALEVSPEWSKQADVRFQLDNIRVEKGTVGTTAATYCYSDFLDTAWVNGVRGPGVKPRAVSGSIDFYTGGYFITGVNPSVKVKPNWQLMKGIWDVSIRKGMDYVTEQPLEPVTLSACSGVGVLSMEIYIPKSYVDDATLKFTVHFADKFEKVFVLPNSSFNVSDLKPDEWNKISVNLSSATQYSDLLYVGLTFESLLVKPSITDTIEIDNILITSK
jgi:hypothetical protein